MTEDEFNLLVPPSESLAREAAFRVLVRGEVAYQVGKALGLSTGNVSDAVKRVRDKDKRFKEQLDKWHNRS